MATGFSLFPGYHSGHIGDWDEAWDVIKDVYGRLLEEHMNEIKWLAHVFGFDDVVLEETGKTFVEWTSDYLSSAVDVYEWDPDGPDTPKIHIMASGGGPARGCKEAIAMAVMHIMFRECGIRGAQVCIVIS